MADEVRGGRDDRGRRTSPWGKMHTRSADYLRRAYPCFGDFVALRDELDLERRFGNAYLAQVLGP
jgi:L-gulonolactone oxidase